MEPLMLMKAYFLYPPAFLFVSNWKKQDELGVGRRISFLFRSHTATVVSQDLQNVTATAGQTKALFRMEGSFLSAPLSDDREVGLCTLSDEHRIHWLHKTLKGLQFILLNLSSGTNRLPLSILDGTIRISFNLLSSWTMYIKQCFCFL